MGVWAADHESGIRFAYDFAVSEETVIVLEVKLTPNVLKLTPYGSVGVLSTNPSSVSLPNFSWWSQCLS